MTTVAPYPRLGDDPATFARRFGPPLRTVNAGYGTVRRYYCAGRELVAFFEQERAVAIRCSYARREVRSVQDTGPRPADFDVIAEPRVLVGDDGWVVATPGCPLGYIRALSEVR